MHHHLASSWLLTASLTSCLFAGCASVAQGDDAQPVAIPETFEIETLTDGYAFTEGPALAPDGSIYFSDIPKRAIHRYDPATGKTTLITDDSGGSNGLMFTPGGKILLCESQGRQVSIRDLPDENNTDRLKLSVASVVKGEYNSPNDVAILLSGHAAYFTDPNYPNHDNPSGIEGVYRINLQIATRSIPAQHPTQRVIDDLQRPNGIGLSPDNRTLYVADNRAKKIMAYPLDENGERDGEGDLFHDLSDMGGPDGMTVDAHGRLFVAVYDQGVVVISPDGKERLGFVPTGKQTTNCVFGEDGKSLYITADNGLKRVVLEH